MAVETGQGRLVEYLGDEAEVLEHRHGLTIRRGDARRLLTAVLETVEPEVDQAGHTLAGGICGKDPARLAGPTGEQDGYLLGHSLIVGRAGRLTYSGSDAAPKTCR